MTTSFQPYQHGAAVIQTHIYQRLVFYCQTTSVSAAHAAQCATYCTPCRPLIGAFSDGFGYHLLPHIYHTRARAAIEPALLWPKAEKGTASHGFQGCLAHNKQPPLPRTTIGH